MNGQELLTAFSQIDDRFVEEAAFSTPARSHRKLVVLALAAALTVLLVGCAVAYVLNMENLKLGSQQSTQDVFSTEGDYVGQETVSEQVLTFSGLKGSANYQAARDWFDFTQSYDPEQEILSSVWKQMPEYYYNEYQAYDVYTDDMVAKLQEISQTYNLKLLGPPQNFRTASAALRAMNIRSFLREDSGATVDLRSLTCYEGGNFILWAYANLPDDFWDWDSHVSFQFYYHNKEYFNSYSVTLNEADNWREWNYTTTAGQEVLILRSEGHSVWVFCDRPDNTLAVTFSADHFRSYSADGKLTREVTSMTDEEIEAFVELIDFSLSPTPISTDADFAGLDVVGGQTQDGFTLEFVSAVTDSYAAEVRLSITAPEGTELRGTAISTGTVGNLFEDTGNSEHYFSAVNIKVTEDGDGLSHTAYLDFTMDTMPWRDGPTVEPGSSWSLYIENLLTNAGPYQTDILAEGVWNIDIPFTLLEESMELISQPITTRAVVGFSKDGDVSGDVTITSLTLRPMSALLLTDTDFAPDFGPLTVVYKDGKKVRLTEYSGAPDSLTFLPTQTLELDKIDHVILTEDVTLYPNSAG